jgi:DNA-binding transcriptional ArsR family regulator
MYDQNISQEDISSSPHIPPLGGEKEERPGSAPIIVKTKRGLSIQIETCKYVVSSVPAEREYLIDGLAPTSGMVIVGSAPKIGKSTLMLHLGRSVTMGEPFLGMDTQKRPVLYVNYEMPRDYFSELAKTSGAVTENFFYIDRPEPRLKVDTIKDIIGALGKLGFPTGIFIIDSFRGAFKLDGDGENLSGEAGLLLREIQEIALVTGWTIFIIHHDKKNTKKTSTGLSNLSGSGDFGAAADVIWSLKRQNASSPTVLEVEGRLPQIDPFTIKLSPSECTNLGYPAQEIKQRSEEELILKTLGSGRLQAKEVSEQTGLSLTTVGRRLTSLKKQGKIDSEKITGTGSPREWFRKTLSDPAKT